MPLDKHLPISLTPTPWKPFYSPLVYLCQIPHINDIIQYFCFSVWLTSLRIMPSGPSMSQVAEFPSFLWISNSWLNMHVYVHTHIYTHIIWSHIFIHSSAKGNLGCFHILAMMNARALNRVVQMSLWDTDFISLYMYPEIGLLNHMEVQFFYFFSSLHTIFHSDHIIFHSH